MTLVLFAFLIVATLITKNSKLKIKKLVLTFSEQSFRCPYENESKILITNTKIINGELLGDIEVSSSKLKSTTVSKKIILSLIDELPILFC